MAEASVPLKHLDDILSCSICTEVYSDPRVLPCVHTYCLKCITSWCGDKQPGDTLACSLCRKEITVPQGGIGELPKNIFVDNLLELKKLRSSVSVEANLCDVCCDRSSKSVDEKAVKYYCMDCRQNMCEDCSECHRKMRVSVSHRLIDVGSAELAEAKGSEKYSEPFCETHPDERMKLYCFECKTAVCMMCLVTSHRSHDCADVKEVATEMSGKLRIDVDAVAEKVPECKEMLLMLSKMDEDYSTSVGEIEREIRCRTEDIKQLIVKYRDDLLDELKSLKITHDKKMANVKYEVERQEMMIISFRKYSEELMQKGTACDIARAASGLSDRARELAAVDLEVLAEIDSFKTYLTFACRDLLLQITDIKNFLGKLDTQNASAGVFPTSFKPTYVMPSKKKWLLQPILGVATLNDEVFVVRSNTQQVDVYYASSMSDKRIIAVPELTGEVFGLAACGVNRCLYLSEYGTRNSVIFRIDVCNDKTITKWPVDGKLYGLTVTQTCNVLIAVYRDRKLKEYTTHGVPVREIQLCREIQQPVEAVQLDDDLFGVTHSGRNHAYSVIDASGNIIKTYGKLHGSGDEQLNFPRGIAVNKRNNVFIADRDNNRIVVVNANTSRSRKLNVTGAAFCRPMCLCIDKSRDRLYIGEGTTGFFGPTGGRIIIINNVKNLQVDD